MKYIKLFEKVNGYMYGKDMLFINDAMNYLKVDTMPLDEQYKPTSLYDVDVIDFFKEIFADKYITFNPVNKTLKGVTSSTSDKVEKVKYFVYKDDVYIQIKFYNDDAWYLIPNNNAIFIKNYDADTKPLHKEVAMKKDAEKYNV